MRKVVSAVFLACFGFPVHAADNLYSQSYNSCMDKSGGVTADMRDCMGQEYKRQDARLNKAYRNLASQLSAGRKAQLLAAQRLWIQYRDANCKFYLDSDGGTMALINADSCGLDMTARRAKELESLVQ